MENKKAVILTGILIFVLIALFMVFLYLSLTPQQNITGKTILNRNNNEMDVAVIMKENSFIMLKITNNDNNEYYIEHINVEGCEDFDNIIPISPSESKKIKIICPENYKQGDITIYYKKQDNNEQFKYIF